MDEKRLKQARFDYERLSAIVGQYIALYCVCAVYDMAFNVDAQCADFTQYVEENGKISFSEKTTDVQSAILAGMDEGERWRTIWGDGYTDAEYKQLDDLYGTMTAQLDSTGGIDRQQDDTARTCAMMALQRNKLIRAADKDSIAMAKQLDAMIRDNLKDSNMRKADILPQQQQRPDGFVDALKKKLGLTMEMTKDEVLQAFFTWCRSKHYPETVDAEEHALMAILRTMQKNDDLPEPSDLPEDMSLAAFEHQFASEPNEMEQDAYGFLHIVRGEFQKGDDE